MTIWTPHLTVAVICEQHGRFLTVEESDGGRRVLNQPAGHLEDRESLHHAVVRECLEETAWHFEPQALVGIYRWRSPTATFVRVAFCGRCTGVEMGRALDPDIIAVHWLTKSQIEQRALRSPLVMRAIEDYQHGKRYPLEMLVDMQHDTDAR